MAVLKIPDDLHEWIKKINASLYLRYSKTLNQVEILLHVNKSQIKSKDYDKIADEIYNDLEKDKKKDNGSNVSDIKAI